jgi:hypothetical protein
MGEALTKFHRTTVDVDLVPFEHARKALGTRGYKDTINAALAEVAGDSELAELARYDAPAFSRKPRPRRTIVDIDIGAYAQARAVLGTRGFKDTVDAALRACWVRESLDELVEWIRAGRFPSLTKEELRELRKPRTFS